MSKQNTRIKILPHHNLSLRLFLKSRIMINREFFYVKSLLEQDEMSKEGLWRT